jgi:Glycosyl transferase family 2
MIGVMSSVRVTLESHLPAALPADSRTAVFCFGHCFGRAEPVDSLELVVDGVRYRPTAFAMPRRDVYDWLGGGPEDPERRSYRSGWWATVPVHGGAELAAAVRLAGGFEQVVPLGRVGVAAPARSDLELPPGTIAICMATFEPNPALLQVQLETIRAQTDQGWVCLISDGGSSEQGFARLVESVDGDQRFVISRSEERLGPYRNFERALSMVPTSASLVALADQDDRWYPDKLATLRAALGSARLAYSDQRIVTDEGRVLRDSLWHGRRNDYRNLASLLVANSMPGAAMLFRRELLDVALPFPDAPGAPYHDHWLALAALASGEVRYVDRPLYDYVQHGAAVQGAVVGQRFRRGSGRWRGAYFGGYAMREVQAQTLLARCGRSLPPRKRRALAWFVGAERSPLCFLWLALRPLRRLVGRDETLSGEVALACGILWRWLVRFAIARLPYDASYPDPPRFEQRRLRRWRAGA